MAEQQTTQEIGVVDRAQVVNQGAVVRPLYGERSPMMYHLFDTEMDSVSSFNSIALSAFSGASVFLNLVLSIVISYGFSSGPLTPLGDFLLHRVAAILTLLMLICLIQGLWCVRRKHTLITKIKNETVFRGPENAKKEQGRDTV